MNKNFKYIFLTVYLLTAFSYVLLNINKEQEQKLGGVPWLPDYDYRKSVTVGSGSVGIYTMGANGYFSNLDIRPFVYPDVQFGGIVTETPPTSYRMPLLGGTRIKMTGGGRFIIQ